MTTEIKIDAPATYAIGEQPIETVVVVGMNFAKFVGIINAASSGARTNAEYSKRSFKGRALAQLSGRTADGKPVPMTALGVLGLPLQIVGRVQTAMDAELYRPVEGAGTFEVLSKGDGYTSPIHVKLGTPIKGAAGLEIAELEFMARTFGDLEDIVAADGEYAQTLALMTIAKPVGGTLTSLPSWALDQLTTDDGFALGKAVTKSFFPVPEDS